MAAKETLNLAGTSGTVHLDVGRPHNVIIEGDFGGGAVTHTMTGAVTAIRTPSTSADAYECSVWDSTFTLTGATDADIDIIIEAI